MLEIDGSFGEGGGQILRSALGLSLLTGTAFRIHSIRARRPNPGLQRQHLASVRAATELGKADAKGAALGSREVVFRPGRVEAGSYFFPVGSAGSATLVLQTVLPALLTAGGTSRLALEGGTHNPWAPPFDFLEKAFLPVLNRMGPRVTATLVRRGFYPAGGGRIEVAVEPSARLSPVELLDRGAVRAVRASAVVSRLPAGIAERELRVAEARLGRVTGRVVEDREARGPGNALTIELEGEGITEVFSAIGQKGVSAEEVAGRCCDEAQAYLASGAPVGEHLADQLLIPFALAGGGAFVASGLSSHARTNLEVIRMFLASGIDAFPGPSGATRVEVRPAVPRAS